MSKITIIPRDIILENDKVRLRLLQASDLENLLEYSMNEPNTWKYGGITAAGKDNLKNYIDVALKASEINEFPFIVFDKSTNKYAGSTRFYDINFNFETLQLGYTWYGEAYRGTNLNKNCKYLLLEYAFEVLKMKRVEFRADNLNEVSIAAMKSIGCIVEGVLRQNAPTIIDGIRRDSIILSILQKEWFENVKQNLKNRL